MTKSSLVKEPWRRSSSPGGSPADELGLFFGGLGRAL